MYMFGERGLLLGLANLVGEDFAPARIDRCSGRSQQNCHQCIKYTKGTNSWESWAFPASSR